MGRYLECPKCENGKVGTTIWSCKDCGCIHCEECDSASGTCPNCNGFRMQTAGYIVAECDSEESQNDDPNQFDECPRCGNVESGATIWECKSCGCIHCEECDPNPGNCPNCEDDNLRTVGYIN